MANLQKTLDALQPYVIGIRYIDGLPVVDAVFKEGWTLPDSELVERVKGNDELNYYMIFSKKDGIGLDELLEYVDIVIKANIEREKKHELLKQKVNELKDVFKKTPLAKLKRLKFSFNDEDLIPELNEFDLNDPEVEEPKETKIPYNKNEFVSPGTSVIENDTILESVEYNENFDDEEAELIAEEARAENFKKLKESGKVNNQVKKLNTKVELPPRRTIQETISDDTPDCDCGPDEACGKCIAYKDL